MLDDIFSDDQVVTEEQHQTKNTMNLEIIRWQSIEDETNAAAGDWNWFSTKMLEDVVVDTVPFKSGKTKRCFEVRSTWTLSSNQANFI